MRPYLLASKKLIFDLVMGWLLEGNLLGDHLSVLLLLNNLLGHFYHVVLLQLLVVYVENFRYIGLFVSNVFVYILLRDNILHLTSSKIFPSLRQKLLVGLVQGLLKTWLASYHY